MNQDETLSLKKPDGDYLKLNTQTIKEILKKMKNRTGIENAITHNNLTFINLDDKNCLICYAASPLNKALFEKYQFQIYFSEENGDPPLRFVIDGNSFDFVQFIEYVRILEVEKLEDINWVLFNESIELKIELENLIDKVGRIGHSQKKSMFLRNADKNCFVKRGDLIMTINTYSDDELDAYAPFNSNMLLSGKCASKGYEILSSGELKKDSKNFNDENTDNLIKLVPKQFKWKDNDCEDIGLVAEEVAELLPKVVNKNETGYVSIDYNKLLIYVLLYLKKQSNHS